MSDLHAQLEHLIDELLANGLTLQQARDEFERRMAAAARRKARGNATQAAKMLGVHRNTLINLCPSDRAEKLRQRKAARSAMADRLRRKS